jgi:tRNA threonylcarbamoyl adenosine modification protein YeaZ
VAGVLHDAGVAAGDLTAVVAGLGPGPFTGLRVGLVTAAVLGQTLGIPTYGVCSLDGIGAVTTGATLVATDARRKEVYWAGYRDGVRVDGPAVAKPADVPVDGYERAAGEGAAKYGLGLTLLEEPRYPVPLALARCAADRIRAHADAELLTPLYLRRPDAVEPGVPKAVLR